MIVAELLPFPGRCHLFDWLPEDELPTMAELTALVVDTLDRLSPVLRPLAVEMGLGCAAGMGRPAPTLRHCLLRQDPLPTGVHCDSTYLDAEVESAPRLGAARIGQWITEVLGRAPCPDDQTAQWTELRIDTSLARWTLSAAAIAAGPELSMGGDRPLPLPVVSDSAGDWLAGPLPAFADRPPLALAISHEAGALRLRLTVHWAAWNAAASDGPAALPSVLAQLPQLGWQAEEAP